MGQSNENLRKKLNYTVFTLAKLDTILSGRNLLTVVMYGIYCSYATYSIVAWGLL